MSRKKTNKMIHLGNRTPRLTQPLRPWMGNHASGLEHNSLYY